MPTGETVVERPRAFFAYPSRPNLRRETLADAAREIGQVGEVECITWEDLAHGARVIIRAITDAIDRAAVSVFDITDLNHNVLFELGYAIGRERRVWLLRDDSMRTSGRDWQRFALLQGISHTRYENSHNIANSFWTERPDQESDTIFTRLLEHTLEPAEPDSVLYIPGPYETNASRAIDRRLSRERSRDFTLRTLDTRESPVQPLPWYAQALNNTLGSVVYLCNPARQDAPIHNARSALLAGLALGLGKRTLMLAEEGYETPIDYQEHLYVFRSQHEAVAQLAGWLARNSDELRVATEAHPSEPVRLATELRAIRLGNHVAENESDTLTDYFVTTQSYLEVLSGGVRLFIGRKGTGKTANLIRAAEELGDDARNLVCIIKPPGYELDSLVRLVRRYRQKDAKAYLVESLWKFLLFSELASVTAAQLRAHELRYEPGSPEGQLLNLVDGNPSLFQPEFAVRLENAVDSLLTVDVDTGVAIGRTAIAEAMHETIIRSVRDTLGRVLSSKHRVAILIDNLDKAWERDADLPQLSQLLLGLLGSMRPVAAEFATRELRNQPVDVSLAVFLRSDIYWHVAKAAREPDKLLVSRLEWTDPELLRRVLEDRYAAATGSQGMHVWDRYFVETVLGMATKEWIVASVLPRPRDLIYLANAAITHAVNRQHIKVEEKDLLDGVKEYSGYAVDSILVEGQADMAEVEAVIYEFAGAPQTMSESEVKQRIRAAKRKHGVDEIVRQLRSMSFLGVASGSNAFSYVDDPREEKRVDAIIASRSTYADEPVRYAVHPAFRPFLDIRER